MKNFTERYWNFLKEFVREDSDMVFIFFGLLLLVVGIIAPFAILGDADYPILIVAMVMLIPILIFVFECFAVFPLIFAFKEVKEENEFNQLVIDCLRQVCELREVMLPGQVYHLSKGYSGLHNGTNRVKELLERALGPEFQVRVECHSELRNYRVELVKLLELGEIP